MNDEDIKILEKLLNKKYDDELLNTLKTISKKDEIYILTIFEKKAIKNLLKENGELRKKVKKLEEENKILKEEINYWKECAEGEAGLRKQIQEDYQEQMQELLEIEE